MYRGHYAWSVLAQIRGIMIFFVLLLTRGLGIETLSTILKYNVWAKDLTQQKLQCDLGSQATHTKSSTTLSGFSMIF